MNAFTPIAPAAHPSPSEGGAETRAATLVEQLDAEMAAMHERHLCNLAELTEIGMGLARAVRRRTAEVEARIGAGAEDQDKTTALNDLGLTLNRITRAVRLSMGLEARVRADRRARLLELQAERMRVEAARAAAEKSRIDGREGFIGRLVEETAKLAILRRNGFDASALEDADIEYDDAEDAEIDWAICEAERLLMRTKAYAGFADRPVSAVVAQVCKDLGLTPDWSVWADEEWAMNEAEEVEGSPFAGLAPRKTGPP